MSDESSSQEEYPEFESEEEFAKEVILAHLLNQPVRLTWFLLASIVLLWGAAWLFGGAYLLEMFGPAAGKASGVQLAVYTGLKLNSHILDQGQWWRLISSTFTHLDVLHIAFNGYGLYSLGPLIERFYGRTRMILLYLGTGVIATVCSMVFSDVPSGGASGAIYGLVGALLVFGYRHKAFLPERVSHALTRGMLPWVIFGIGIGFFGSIPMDNAAHIGGLVSGMILAWIIGSHLSVEQPVWKTMTIRLVAGALVGATILSFIGWGAEIKKCTPSLDAYAQCYPKLFTIKKVPVSPPK